MPKFDARWFDSPTHVALFLGGLLIAIGGTIAYLVIVPAATRADVQGWLGPLLIAIASSGGATSVVSVIAGRASSRVTVPERIESAAPRRTGGFATIDAMLLAIAGGAIVMLLSGLLHGCGASALQTAALGTTVALRATHAIDQVYETDLERRLSECPGATSSDAAEIVNAHNACGDAIRAGERDIATVLDALPVAIEAFGAGVAVQTELDAGAAIPAVVLDAVRTVLSLFDQVEVMLRARGVVIPPAVDMVVRALSALLPPPSGAA